MKFRAALFGCLGILSLAGCGGSSDAADAEDVEDQASEVKTPTWNCVSGVDTTGLASNVVFRLSLTQTSKTAWRIAGDEGFLFGNGTHGPDGPFKHWSNKLNLALGEGGWFGTFAHGSLQLFPNVENPALPGGRATIDGKNYTLSCYQPGFKRPFSYRATSGKCKNAAGEIGMNDIPLDVVRETRDGECTAIEGTLNGGDSSYPELRGWNLTGANLDKARLEFANLLDADLRGASLTGLVFGYARVMGKTDSFTHEPVGCPAASKHVDCAH